MGGDWTDVSIHNVSEHGMMLQAVAAPRPGTYLEIRRSALIIIARTIWSKGHFFGIRTQEIVDPRLLAQGRSIAALDGLTNWNGAERRARTRSTVERYQESRNQGLMLQFAVIVGGIAATTAWVAFNLWAPLMQNSAALQAALSTAP